MLQAEGLISTGIGVWIGAKRRRFIMRQSFCLLKILLIYGAFTVFIIDFHLVCLSVVIAIAYSVWHSGDFHQVDFSFFLSSCQSIQSLLLFYQIQIVIIFFMHLFFIFITAQINRTMIHTRRILELLHLVSLKLKLCGDLPYRLNHIYGSMCTLEWR